MSSVCWHQVARGCLQRAPRPRFSPEMEKDLWWYFEQQRRFLFDLRSAAVSPEESVAADQHQAWNLKVISQQREIERLKAQVSELEADKVKMKEDIASALRERDDWKASALH